MFNRNTCVVATNMASSLQARHIKMTPASNEMGVLIEQVIYPIAQSGVEWGEDSHTDLIKTMSLHDMSDETSISDQQEAIDEYTHFMAKTLKTNLNLTRRVAIPLIEKTFDEACARLDELKISSYESDMCDIRACHEYRIGDNAMFTDMVMKYATSNFSDAPNTARLMPSMGADELRVLLKTGSDTFDNQISDTLLSDVESENQPFIVKVWNKHFLHPEAINTMHTQGSVSNRGMDLKEWSLAFLLANGLLTSDIPDGVSVDLETYKSIINRYRAYCGYNVQRLIKNYQAKRSTDMLVFDDYIGQNGTSVLVVIEEVLEKATAAGIGPEVIMGYRLNGGTSWFLDTLIKTKAESLRAFEEKSSQRAVGLQMRARKILRETVLESIQQFSKTTPVIDDVGTTIKTSPSVETITTQMNTITREIEDVFDTPSILKYIQDTITDGLFSGTMVSLIIKRMDIFMNVNDYSAAVDVRHAGLMAAVSICVESLLSQFQVELCLDK